MVEVPEQLQDEDFRFVKIQSGKKWPFEKNWQKDGNYKYNDEEFKDWQKNYGVVCGFGNLTVIDADNQVTEKAVENNLPDTFTVQTGGGGKHYYFICNDIKKPIRLKQEEYGDLGDVQFKGKQVVGPGSKHPSGNRYKVIKDREISQVSATNIKMALKDLIQDSTAEDVKEEEQEKTKENDLDIDLDITDVVDLTGLKKRGDEYQGPHPVHGSKTKQNFTVNPIKNVWHCFRKNCDSGGGPLSWIAVKEGIISCSEAQPGSLEGDKFKKVLEVAEEKYDLDLETNVTGKSTSLIYNKPSKLTNSISALKSKKTRCMSYIQGREAFLENWEKITALYHDSQVTKKQARFQTAQHFLKNLHFVTHPKTEELYVMNDGTYRPKGERYIREQCRGYLGSDVTDHDLQEIVKTVKDVTYIPKEEFEENDAIINAKNCDLVWGNGGVEKKEIDPENITLSRLPWEYNPDAECPKIKEFLGEVLRDDWIPTVQEMMGLALANKHLTRKAFMLYGGGSNGKDILLTLIEKLLGEENIADHTLHYLNYNPFAPFSLVGKLANISGDLSKKEIKKSSVFKRITGNSAIQVEPKGKSSFRCRLSTTLIFAANTTPTFEENTYALYDRWVIVTFPYKFTDDPDDEHKDKIPREELLSDLTTEEEMEGLFKWAVEGLGRLKKNNFKLTNQQTPEEIKEAWLQRSDSITAFAQRKLEDDPENVIPKRNLYNEYRDWCVDNNYSPEGMQKVGKKLPTKSSANADQTRINGKNTKVWKGIKLTSESVELNQLKKQELLTLLPDDDKIQIEKLVDRIVLELDCSEERAEEILEKLEEVGDIVENPSGYYQKM